MGKVYLVGAGPGADDLITLRGARVLGMADVVLHDALIEPAMLDLARPQAIRIAVGKRHGQAGVDQGDINEMIVDAGRRYPVVVRLKGGDPMLYARADEEMRVLEAAGLPFEIVPGITTALAGAAAIRRSLTLRGVARSVCFSTASHASGSAPGIPSLDADSHVVYMVANAPRISPDNSSRPDGRRIPRWWWSSHAAPGGSGSYNRRCMRSAWVQPPVGSPPPSRRF